MDNKKYELIYILNFSRDDGINWNDSKLIELKSHQDEMIQVEHVRNHIRDILKNPSVKLANCNIYSSRSGPAFPNNNRITKDIYLNNCFDFRKTEEYINLYYVKYGMNYEKRYQQVSGNPLLYRREQSDYTEPTFRCGDIVKCNNLEDLYIVNYMPIYNTPYWENTYDLSLLTNSLINYNKTIISQDIPDYHMSELTKISEIDFKFIGVYYTKEYERIYIQSNILDEVFSTMGVVPDDIFEIGYIFYKEGNADIRITITKKYDKLLLTTESICNNIITNLEDSYFI